MYAAVGVLSVVVGLVAAGLHAVNAAAGRTLEPSFWLMQVMVAVGYGVLTLAVRGRASRALRLTVAGIAAGAALSVLAVEWGTADRDATWVVWFGSWAWAPGYTAIIALLPQLLPDGTLVSPRWRGAAWFGVATVGVVSASWALWPYEDQDQPQLYTGLTNPVGVELVSDPGLSTGFDLMLAAGVLVAGASVVVRWRRSRDVRRQQLKWLLVGVLATVACAFLARLLPMPVDQAVAAVAMLPLPVAIGAAVLRLGLWDVDVVLSRALVYGAVALAAVGLYVATVGLVGTLTDAASGQVPLVVVALLAPLLLPVHGVLRRRVNRWIHGDDEEPGPELLRLGERLGTVADPEQLVERVLPDMLRRVARALRAVDVRLVLTDGTEVCDRNDRRGDAMSRVDDVSTADGGEADVVAVPLAYAGERLGVLHLRRPGGFGAVERRALDRWAGQAAVAVHTVLLAREARRSRELVVKAREEERRRLRRDLHDGVGPSLAALALQVETARDLAKADPDAAAGLLTSLAPRINAVVADIRSLVHELRPPTLDELGLAGATQELAARLSATSRVDVEADAEKLGCLPAAVEVAAYRIVGEAVTNAVRHSGAGAIGVRLLREADSLLVQVVDDGSGLVTEHAAGVGLPSMRQRAEELGGSLDVRSSGTGTAVTARLPLDDADPSDRIDGSLVAGSDR